MATSSNVIISFAAFVLLALCPLTQGFSALQNKADFICPSDGNYAKPGAECTRVYYKCANGTVTEMDCPIASVFDPCRRICITNQTSCSCNCSSCMASTTSSTTTLITSTLQTNNETVTPSATIPPTTSSTGSTTTQDPSIVCYENGNFPNPDDCYTFYMCSNGISYLYECPSNLVFNPQTGTCDYPANVPGC